MRIASAAGIAPQVHHIDEVNRVAIMDFVEERPLSTFPGGPMRSLMQSVRSWVACRGRRHSLASSNTQRW
jgi:hypothetical protein